MWDTRWGAGFFQSFELYFELLKREFMLDSSLMQISARKMSKASASIDPHQKMYKAILKHMYKYNSAALLSYKGVPT